MSRRTIILSVLLLAIAAAVAIYFLVINKPHQDVADLKPEVKIEANQLYQEYSNDESEANSLYLGKILEVKGIFAKSSVGEAGVASIYLTVDSEIDNVICELDEVYKAKLPDLQEGDEVTVRGWCSGSMGDVILSRCVIVN